MGRNRRTSETDWRGAQIIRMHGEDDNVIRIANKLVICVVWLQATSGELDEFFLIWHDRAMKSNFAVAHRPTLVYFETHLGPLIEKTSSKREAEELIGAVEAFLQYSEDNGYVSVEER